MGRIIKFPEPVKKSGLAEFCAYWQKALDEFNAQYVKKEIARKMPVLQEADSPKSEGVELQPERKSKVQESEV